MSQEAAGLIRTKLRILAVTLLFALTLEGKSKHSISDYNHVGVLFIYVTGVDQHGPNVYHEGDYTCITYDDPHYGPDCSENAVLLEFRTDDGKEHLVLPGDGKKFQHDVLEQIYLDPKNFKAMAWKGPGVRFVYRVDGDLIYVPLGKVDKHGNIHVSGEKSYLL